MHGQYSRERLGDEQSKKAVTVSVLEREWKVPWGVSGRTWECQSGTELQAFLYGRRCRKQSTV